MDIVLADPWKDPDEDQRLDDALQDTKNLVLATQLDSGRWENPLPIFRQLLPRWATTAPMNC